MKEYRTERRTSVSSVVLDQCPPKAEVEEWFAWFAGHQRGRRNAQPSSVPSGSRHSPTGQRLDGVRQRFLHVDAFGRSPRVGGRCRNRYDERLQPDWRLSFAEPATTPTEARRRSAWMGRKLHAPHGLIQQVTGSPRPPHQSRTHRVHGHPYASRSSVRELIAAVGLKSTLHPDEFGRWYYRGRGAVVLPSQRLSSG